MKKFSRKIVATAVAMVAGSGSALAAVNIDAATPAPAVFASEIVASSAAPVDLTNAATLTDLTTAIGYALSNGEVRYVRVEVTNATFRAGTTAAISTAGAAVGAVNGIGTSAIYFSVTAPAAGILTTDTITVPANLRITGTSSNVTVTYSLYDQPSQAASGGATGRIVNKADKPFVSFAASQRVVFTSANDTINVEANPAFTTFLTGAGNVRRTNLGTINYALAAAVPNTAAGAAITLANLNAVGATGTKLNVTGDFTGAANSDGTYTGAALNRVYLSANADCSTVDLAVSTVTATVATFNVGATATTANQNLCFAPRLATGNTNFASALPEATYTVALAPVSAAPATYAVSAISATGSSVLTRNGTTLQAPLVQVPSGYIARFVLTNTGTVAAPYSGTVTAGAGSTVASNGSLSGSIPAGGQVIIEGADMPTFTGTPRGFATFFISRPSAQVQGLYQIVNPTTGSVSNTVMVRPGTN